MKFNDEEKEAIEHFKAINNLYLKTQLDLHYTESEYDNSVILLNLIEKLDLEQASAKAERDVIKEKAERLQEENEQLREELKIRGVYVK